MRSGDRRLVPCVVQMRRRVADPDQRRRSSRSSGRGAAERAGVRAARDGGGGVRAGRCGSRERPPDAAMAHRNGHRTREWQTRGDVGLCFRAGGGDLTPDSRSDATRGTGYTDRRSVGIGLPRGITPVAPPATRGCHRGALRLVPPATRERRPDGRGAARTCRGRFNALVLRSIGGATWLRCHVTARPSGFGLGRSGSFCRRFGA
jgi:hypothetical protein